MQPSMYEGQWKECSWMLNEHEIWHGATICVSQEKEICIQSQSGKTIVLMQHMSHNHSVGMVKKEIEKKLGIAVMRQQMFFNDDLLHDHNRLTESESFRLMLVNFRDQSFYITIQVEPDGNLLCPIPAESKDTVAFLKRKINDIESIPAASQMLFFAGEMLQDHRTLQSYMIEQGNTLKLRRA